MTGNYTTPDVKRGRLSPAEVGQIRALADRGFSPGRIALRLRRHPATISYAMIRLGLRTVVPRTFSYVRNGYEVRSFSDAEDRALEALRVEGLSLVAIAAALSREFGHKRSHHTVGIRLKMLASLEAAA